MLAAPRRPGLCSLIVTVNMFATRIEWLRFTIVALAPLAAAGCDPIVNIQGSFFPAWILCMLVGLVGTAAGRQAFVLTHLEPHVGPLVLIYPSLWLLTTLLTWLVFYRT
jgi:YtcA-like protein